MTIAVADILASNAQLARTVKEFSKHLDSVDDIIDALSDTETRNRLKQLTKLSRETLTNATFEFFQAIRKVAEATIRNSWTISSQGVAARSGNGST